VVGPYASINCTLTLLANKIRINSNAQTEYAEQDAGDSRFVTNFAAMQSIATSHAQNDSGMFELSFRDERYLPFEGAGVISRWSIEMPKENNAFDFSTISDVVVKLSYTAREGGDLLRQKAKESIFVSSQENNIRTFSARHEFPNEWYRFLNPSDSTATSQILKLDLTMDRFPFLLRGKNIQIDKVGLFLNFREAKYYTDYPEGQPLDFTLGFGNTSKNGMLKSDPSINGMPTALVKFDSQTGIPGSITLTVIENNIKIIAQSLQRLVGLHTRMNTDALEDLFIVCWYSTTG